MKKSKIHISQRGKCLWGLSTPRRYVRQNYLLRVGLFVLLALPWLFVVCGLMETWRSYAIGDAVSIPLWAWVAVVVLPVVAGCLSRMMANRLVMQYIIRKRISL